jgi:hypothetical protein
MVNRCRSDELFGYPQSRTGAENTYDEAPLHHDTVAPTAQQAERGTDTDTEALEALSQSGKAAKTK